MYIVTVYFAPFHVRLTTKMIEIVIFYNYNFLRCHFYIFELWFKTNKKIW